MSNVLVKMFVKDYDNIGEPRVRKSYGMLSSFVGIVCNIILFLTKFAIGALSNSIAIISDGFNNLSDCASCVITMFGYKLAAKPADKDHPFGHGRMEYLTSLVIAMVIMVVDFQLFRDAAQKIIHPEEVHFSTVALVALVISVFVKVWMGLFNMKLGKTINSSVMMATSKDSFNDVIATAATIIALVASIWTDAPIDGIMGIIVAIFIFFSGYEIIKETVDELLGQPADLELVEQLKEMVEANGSFLGVHDLIIHSYGPGNLIGSMHIEVDAAQNVMEIHDIIDEFERQVYDKLNIRMTVHMDPVEPNNEVVKKCRDMVSSILSDISKELEFHDFRVVSGPSHTNLVFDVVVPYGFELGDRQIKERIDAKLCGYDTKYYTVITFDKSY